LDPAPTKREGNVGAVNNRLTTSAGYDICSALVNATFNTVGNDGSEVGYRSAAEGVDAIWPICVAQNVPGSGAEKRGDVRLVIV
jgi:hypothetical protein